MRQRRRKLWRPLCRQRASHTHEIAVVERRPVGQCRDQRGGRPRELPRNNSWSVGGTCPACLAQFERCYAEGVVQGEIGSRTAIHASRLETASKAETAD